LGTRVIGNAHAAQDCHHGAPVGKGALNKVEADKGCQPQPVRAVNCCQQRRQRHESACDQPQKSIDGHDHGALPFLEKSFRVIRYTPSSKDTVAVGECNGFPGYLLLNLSAPGCPFSPEISLDPGHVTDYVALIGVTRRPDSLLFRPQTTKRSVLQRSCPCQEEYLIG
jgi:hypothetical protein